jgi:hypothetical protein
MEAPMLWADVFRIKMKAIGLSILVLNDRQMRPTLGFLLDKSATCEGVRLRRTASTSEHKAETTKATDTLTTNITIYAISTF